MRKPLLFSFLCTAFLLCSCSAGGADADQAQSVAATEAVVTASVVTTEDTSAAMAESAAVAYSYGRTIPESEESVSDIHYFTFHQKTTTYTDEENRVLLLETLTKPVFYATDTELNEWVNGIITEIYSADAAYGQELLQYARSNLSEIGEDQFYTHSYHISMEIGRHDDSVVSLISSSSIYSGGAQPHSIQTAYNLDLNSKRVLSLEDVIIPEGVQSLKELVQTTVESLFSSMGEGALFDQYADTIEATLEYGNMTPYWYFDEEGMVIFFNQYTLGPYASGVIRVQISYDDLNGILMPQYFPESYIGTATGISFDSQPIPGEWVYYIDLAEGETIYISIVGQAYHIQLSEISWVEQTPVGESMLFSANYVDDITTFAVTGNLKDSTKVYALEYFDEHGGPNVLYIQGLEVIKFLPSSE